MGQDASKVSPPPPPPPPPIVDDREDCVLSPILFVKDREERVRATHHIAFHKPSKDIYSIDIENPTADDSIGLPLNWRGFAAPIKTVVPGLNGHSLVVFYTYTFGSGLYTRRFERLSNGMVLRDGFMGICIESELTPKDFLNRRPFVPVGDPKYDAFACLFDFRASPPALPNGTEDLQSNSSSTPS